jgi:hypothetical protein
MGPVGNDRSDVGTKKERGGISASAFTVSSSLSELYDDFHAQPADITLSVPFWQGKSHPRRNAIRYDKAGHRVDEVVPLDIGTTESRTLCFQIERRRGERK